MKKTIDLCYVEEKGEKGGKGEKYWGKIDRAEILEKMEEFKEKNPTNNEISTKLVKLLPQTHTLLINKKMKIDEMPIIICIIEGRNNIVKIPYHHKKIWTCLTEYGEKIKSGTHKS